MRSVGTCYVRVITLHRVSRVSSSSRNPRHTTCPSVPSTVPAGFDVAIKTFGASAGRWLRLIGRRSAALRLRDTKSSFLRSHKVHVVAGNELHEVRRFQSALFVFKPSRLVVIDNFSKKNTDFKLNLLMTMRSGATIKMFDKIE